MNQQRGMRKRTPNLGKKDASCLRTWHPKKKDTAANCEQCLSCCHFLSNEIA